MKLYRVKAGEVGGYCLAEDATVAVSLFKDNTGYEADFILCLTDKGNTLYVQGESHESNFLFDFMVS